MGGRSLYVAFMGTKQARDVSTDLAFAHEAVWVAAEQQATAAAQVGEGLACGDLWVAVTAAAPAQAHHKA